MSHWQQYYGRWWTIQGAVDGWFSLGIHVDFRSRRTASGRRYGPYVDFHLGFVILSLGVNPIYASDLDLDKYDARGGLRASEH